MDEEEFEMMMHYFPSLRRKLKITCAKKKSFWVGSVFQKRKRLGEYNQLLMESRLGDRLYFFK